VLDLFSETLGSKKKNQVSTESKVAITTDWKDLIGLAVDPRTMTIGDLDSRISKETELKEVISKSLSCCQEIKLEKLTNLDNDQLAARAAAVRKELATIRNIFEFKRKRPSAVDEVLCSCWGNIKKSTRLAHYQ